MGYDYSKDKTLDKIKRIIVRKVSPNKIILFGSRARGEEAINSDYDILVIKDNVDNEREITRQINYELLKENIKQEVDILSTSTDKWKKNKKNIAYIYPEVESEGVVIYG